jgi:hypothetical protein
MPNPGGLCLKVLDIVCLTETLTISSDPRDFEWHMENNFKCQIPGVFVLR